MAAAIVSISAMVTLVPIRSCQSGARSCGAIAVAPSIAIP
jgi:hypothetical protein